MRVKRLVTLRMGGKKGTNKGAKKETKVATGITTPGKGVSALKPICSLW
jgi:hypothetical protein